LQSRIATYESGISNKGIWQHRKKDGSLVMVNIISNDIVFAGKHAKLILSNDMTAKIIAEEKLKHSHEELRQLATHLQTVREAERTHMAREIHDELGQQLTGLKMDIAWIAKRIGDEQREIKHKISETLKLVDETVQTVRRLATKLRPSILDDLGLVAAMEWQSEEFQRRFGINTTFMADVNHQEIPAETATAFFRIYQECLTNVMRHADASNVTADLRLKSGSLHLTVADDGIGFHAQEIETKKTLGLLGMKERTLLMGGFCEISGKPGKGTTVVIISPIKPSSEL
jgi:signal transduction histidine kinase